MANSLLRLSAEYLLVSTAVSLPGSSRKRTPFYSFEAVISTVSRDPQISCQGIWLWKTRNFSHGSVSFVISPQGNPNFEMQEIEPPEKEKLKTEKGLKLGRKREKQKRKAANNREKEAKVC
ncbi:hypothetical protein CDL12_02647 [Handroanthus impetiginosus]|uniref:Uncharacterized protein n=1 Tax=Handroanthus impetiginosus TaxID=429701 RepID=A0A2G9I4C0_9LAMI|nr:hypothetical protein CDL12_02647 [Handroanthus impetiginosus]